MTLATILTPTIKTSKEKSTKQLKTDFEVTNKRKMRTISSDIEDGETPSKHCKARDTTTRIFAENVSLRSLIKSSESTQSVIKRDRDFRKTAGVNTNVVCLRTQNLTVTKLNKDYKSYGSISTLSMKTSESMEPAVEVMKSLTKTSYTNKTCPQIKKPRFTGKNEEFNPNRSICQNKVLLSDEFSKKTKPTKELTTAKRKSYWGLKY